MSLKKLSAFLGFPVGTPVTGNPVLFQKEDFDMSSRGDTFPVNPQDGDGHYDTVDMAHYRWNESKGLWLGDQLVERSFVDPGEAITGAQPMHRAGGSGNMVKAYVNQTHVAIVGCGIITTQASHDGFDVEIGTLAAATLLTDDKVVISIPAGEIFYQRRDLSLVNKATVLGDAPDTGALSAKLSNLGVTEPDNVSVDVLLRPTPDPARL